MKGITLEENIMVTMSDGIRLAVDVYKPNVEGKFPALLAISPYGKEKQRLPGGFFTVVEAGNIGYFVPKGYVYVIADSRGSHPSEGEWNLFDSKEQEDGYELVEWIARQPWCDGKVALMGESYFAVIQYLVAAKQPPSLKTIIPFDGATDLYRDWTYHGGLWHYGFMAKWIVLCCGRCLPLEGVQPSERWRPPVKVPLDTVLHSKDGPYYWERSAATKFDKIKVPIYHLVCTFNYLHYRGQLNAYSGINTTKKLLVGAGYPWHLYNSEALCQEIGRWLDYWLKGIDTGIMDEPPIKIYMSGAEEWRFENEYPLSRTKWTKLYLHRGEKDSASEPPYGILNEDMPEEETPDSYDYARSQEKVERNLPVLGFSTPPLAQDLEVIGPASLVLYAASTATDMSWVIKIDDIAPDGSATVASKGWLMASHREVDDTRSMIGQPFHIHINPTPIEPNKIYRYEIEIWPLFRVFKAGHKLRIRIASSDSQVWDVGFFHYRWEFIATNSIYHDKQHPSHLILPIIPPRIPPIMQRPAISYRP